MNDHDHDECLYGTEATPGPERYTGRHVDELPEGVTGVVTVAERIVNRDALNLPPLLGSGKRTTHPIDLDTALRVLHAAIDPDDSPERVDDLDRQITAIVAGLLRFASDPAAVTSGALLTYPDSGTHREGALKRLITWRQHEKAAALNEVSTTSTALQEALTSDTSDEDEYDMHESLLTGARTHLDVASAALDAANDALLRHHDENPEN